jgi:hypothetical protein
LINYIRNLMIKDNIMSMQYFQEHGNDEAINQISSFVENGIQKLPWFFRIPIKLFMLLVAAVNIISFSRSKTSVSPIAKKIPLYGMVNKLVRAMTFMILFDVCPDNTTIIEA